VRLVAKKYSEVIRVSKGVASQKQPLRFAAARRRIRNTNLSETPAVTCHLHIFPRSRLDGALGKIFGNFYVDIHFRFCFQRQIAFLLFSTL